MGKNTSIVQAGRASVEQHLKDNPHAINEKDEDEQTLLESAVNFACLTASENEAKNRLSIVEFLEEKKPDVSISGQHGVLLLFTAFIHTKNQVITNYLVLKMTDKNIRDNAGKQIIVPALLLDPPAFIEWCLTHQREQILQMNTNTSMALIDQIMSAYKKNTTIHRAACLLLNLLLKKRREKRRNTRKNTLVDKNNILQKFNKLGCIDPDEFALVLEAKGQSRSQSIFILYHEDLDEFHDLFFKLIVEPTQSQIYKIQIIYAAVRDWHYSFGEISIDKSVSPPKLRFFQGDPAFAYTKPDEVFPARHIARLSKVADLEVYRSKELLQKSYGCSYFALDCCFMLATQMQYEDIYSYMQKHGEHTEMSGVNVSILSPLPARLKRASQLYGDQEAKNQNELGLFKGIKTSVLDIPETANAVVNKKGDTAASSIRKDLTKTITDNKESVFNLRLVRKMLGYQEKVAKVLGNIETYEQLDAIVAKYTTKGFSDYCDEQCKPVSKLSKYF